MSEVTGSKTNPEVSVHEKDRLRKLEKVVASLNVKLLDLQEENRQLKEGAVPKGKHTELEQRNGLIKEREEMATIILQMGESFGLDYGGVDILAPPESLVGHLQYVCELTRNRLGQYKDWIQKFDHLRQRVPCDYPAGSGSTTGDDDKSSINDSNATEISGITTLVAASPPAQVAVGNTPEPERGQREGNWTTRRSDPPLDVDSLEVLADLERYDMDEDMASPEAPYTSGTTAENDATPTTGKQRGRKKGQGGRKDNNYRQRTRFANSKVNHEKVTIASDSPAEGPFRCSCGQVYKHRANLKDHLRKMTEEWKFPCRPCRWFFFYESDLRKHRCTQTCVYFQEKGTGQRKASAASRFPRRASARVSPRGMPVLTKEQFFPPPDSMCMVSSDSEDEEVPSQLDTRELPFHCDRCAKQFGKVHGLKRHLANVHGQVEPLKDVAAGCRACGKLFGSNEEFWEHRRLVHARTTRIWDGQMEAMESPDMEESESDEETIPVLEAEEEAVNSPLAQ